MDVKVELIFVPVADVDRSVAFYGTTLGWPVDYDRVVNASLRFVQVTPPGSACSIAFGYGLGHDGAPGSLHAIQAVVGDADVAAADLHARGVEHTAVDELAWGRFVTFRDPDGNTWTLQQLPARG